MFEWISVALGVAALLLKAKDSFKTPKKE